MSTSEDLKAHEKMPEHHSTDKPAMTKEEKIDAQMADSFPASDPPSFSGGNHIIGNSFVGVYGEANFGAFQYIGVYTFGNDVHSNGTDYLFNAFGGSTQILN